MSSRYTDFLNAVNAALAESDVTVADLDILGDGQVVTEQTYDGTVGTTKSIATLGVDRHGRVRFQKISQSGETFSAPIEDNTDNLLKELKKMNFYLSLMTDVVVQDSDIESS